MRPHVRRWPSGSLALCALLAGGTSACASDQEIQSPSPLSASVPIDYPLDLWDRGIEGSSILKVRVTDVGEVDSVVVIESSGYPAFDSSAVRGARTLKFIPARQGDKRIEVWAHVPVHFSKKPRP
ncbi:MAG: energy transducer TonB [Gemmatimonadetes bacterium]|nr:energy transducer TonB [Gemmatimonadota bacterium]